MSDQEISTTEDSNEKSGAVSAAPSGGSAKKSPPTSGKSSPAGWLALLLVIALSAGVAWVLNEAQQREKVLTNRLAQLESAAGQKDASLQTLAEKLEGEFQSGLKNVTASVGSETFRIAKALEAVETRVGEQGEALARFSASDRDSWLLAEAEYLLRLANQRLIMAGDTVAAQALLSGADAVLRELDNVNLHGARAAVAKDLAAVRAVPKIDVEGIYLRLGAQIDRASELVIFKMPKRAERQAPPPAEDWRGRLEQGYKAALIKLSDYIIVRRRDEPMQALIDPQWEGLVRQNLRMLLEQAQVALLSGNQALYQESLVRAQHWVAEFLESDGANARAISQELAELTTVTIAAAIPDISGSLQALDAAVEQRLQQGGAE